MLARTLSLKNNQIPISFKLELRFFQSFWLVGKAIAMCVCLGRVEKTPHGDWILVKWLPPLGRIKKSGGFQLPCPRSEERAWRGPWSWIAAGPCWIWGSQYLCSHPAFALLPEMRNEKMKPSRKGTRSFPNTHAFPFGPSAPCLSGSVLQGPQSVENPLRENIFKEISVLKRTLKSEEWSRKKKECLSFNFPFGSFPFAKGYREYLLPLVFFLCIIIIHSFAFDSESSQRQGILDLQSICY